MLVQTLQDLRPADSIIVEEAPSTRGAMQRHLPISRPETFFTCASGGLGHSMPAAVGVALGMNDRQAPRKVIAMIGDGSAMYAIQALWSAAQLKLPITFIIVNNSRYQALHHFSQRFGISQPVGTDLPGIDFVRLGEGAGLRGDAGDARGGTGAGAEVGTAGSGADAGGGGCQLTTTLPWRTTCRRESTAGRLPFPVR